MRRCPSEVDLSAVYRRNSRLSPGFWGEVLESGKSTLVGFFRCAAINKRHPANVYFTVEEMNFPRHITWVREVLQYAGEQGTEGEDEGCFLGNSGFDIPAWAGSGHVCKKTR